MAGNAQSISAAWRRRGNRIAVAVGAIGLAIYAAAQWPGYPGWLYAWALRQRILGIDALIVGGFVFCLVMLIVSLCQARALKLETRKREAAEKRINDDARRLATAVNNMPQGIILFDASEHLIVCNDYYLEMYNLSPEVIKPGATLREIFQHRVEAGMLKRNAEQYRTELLTLLAQKKVIRRIVETADGREIAITDYPMADGGWLATHEDRTELRRRDESFRLLFDNNPIAMWVFDRATLRFLAVNDAAVRRYDIRAGDLESSAAYIHAMPETQEEEYAGQHRRADGMTMHVSVYSRTLNYENYDARLVAINDITARKLAEDDLHRTKIFLNAVIENVPMPMVVKTIKDGRFTLINKASLELHGYQREDVIGKTLSDIFPEEHASLIAARDAECLQSGHPTVIGNHLIHTPKGTRLVTSTKVAIPGNDGTPEYLLTLIEDVTERKQVEKQIAHMAHSDSLTDLPNRAAFNERLNVTLKMAEAEQRSFAILCMDLDGFKGINDIYGHAVGDLLLCQIADRLRAAAAGIFVARLGGDEFTMIAANDEERSIEELNECLLAAFVDDFDIDGHRLPQALSIGVAIYPADGADAKTLLKNADAALYRAKANDSSSVCFFEAEIATRLGKRAELQAELSSAIQHNSLNLHYQPQCKMSGEITGFEALARWNSPTRGMVPPGEFIPLAEESSLVLVLGEWVLREACREAASWDKPLNIAINVSPVQFRHGDLPRLVHSILLETGLAPNRLELEITEGVLIGDFSRAVSILRRLKLLGVQIAMDDFGTGYSSLSYLRAFPFDKIKIDRSFISDLESNHQSTAIVHAVIGLGRSLGIPILAEGVETQDQHAFLAREGCSEVQGYLTGRPLAIGDYAEVVRQKTIVATPARAARRP